jgi:hypothetical protein
MPSLRIWVWLLLRSWYPLYPRDRFNITEIYAEVYQMPKRAHQVADVWVQLNRFLPNFVETRNIEKNFQEQYKAAIPVNTSSAIMMVRDLSRFRATAGHYRAFLGFCHNRYTRKEKDT